ncbi:MAG: 3-isopropylmalate dehydratase small subunit [Deltaproteobacteria bacterium]|nr:3-isopropylmalate dehydratase small subunit [Deltaproteobacteria bacterium]MBW1960425.1 3-isopropylmalate dehydratase small subunit [Deltaproteobacteria bacterium]MBW1995709.1 3-isopropylmalate dehydratase small subunit [Deltaproteobacteria bacterium]MBW2153409.1 3-isopropylmalate dehydratase small subunit [Deltaproteobacteria bacterium]
MKVSGKVWKFGDDINTDVIIPARYLNTSDPKELAKHCMEDEDPDFAGKVGNSDIIVAGKYFGCGSSREHAPIAIKAAGVSCVIAKSFARIFYRNSFNMGLPILECEHTDAFNTGDILTVDFDAGEITDQTTGRTYKARPIPSFMQELIKSGGLMKYIARKEAEKAAALKDSSH